MFKNLLYELQSPTPQALPHALLHPTGHSLKTSLVTVTLSTDQGLGINFAEILFYSRTVDQAVND